MSKRNAEPAPKKSTERAPKMILKEEAPFSEKAPASQANRKSGLVAIAGRPNAGKSTIMNALLGSELSIVTPKAQTTRERVNGVLTEKEGQIVFIDTPGIHRARDGGINAYMMNEVKSALHMPEIIWYMVDPDSAPRHEEAVLAMLAEAKRPVYLIFNKTDQKRNLPSVERLEPELLAACAVLGIEVVKTFKISALKKRGLDELMAATWDALPIGPFHFEDEDQISDRPTRFFVSEKIREQLFHLLGDELPYCCAIAIEKFDENSKPVRIEAVIFVERDSQKGMVIGAAGAKIKEIGTAARREIESFLDTKIFLGLNVKVLKDWSKDPERLKQLGYDLPRPKKLSGKKTAS
ncbi:MAG: GTPase Era [Cryobacterium sp.]|nr:GTPase Era [Oligoflexia bacterium]